MSRRPKYCHFDRCYGTFQMPSDLQLTSRILIASPSKPNVKYVAIYQICTAEYLYPKPVFHSHSTNPKAISMMPVFVGFLRSLDLIGHKGQNFYLDCTSLGSLPSILICSALIRFQAFFLCHSSFSTKKDLIS